MGADTPAPAPSGPETPWERYMRQEWPMDRDRFNALVAAEVARATAEWKARAEKAEEARQGSERALQAHSKEADRQRGRAEKAEAERDRYKREADDYEEREAACCPEDVGFDEFIAALKKRAEKAERERDDAKATLDMYANAWRRELGSWPMKVHEIDGLVLGTQRLRERAEKAEAALRSMERERDEARDEAAARSVIGRDAHVMMRVPQAHEEAGARVARKTQEPPSAVGNTLPRAEPDGGGGSATLRLACELRGLQRNEYVDSADRVVAALRPWLAFVEAMAVWCGREWSESPERDAARALLAKTKKEAK